MAVVGILLLLFVCAGAMGPSDPFPVGYSLGNLNTIISDDGIGGRQPWVPAAVIRRNTGFVLAAGAVSYYDMMDNIRDRGIYRAALGVSYAGPVFKCKGAFSQFDAFRMYFSQDGYLSAGLGGVSLEMAGHRIGLRGKKGEVKTIGELGASVWLPFRYASLFLGVEHVVVKESRNGSDPPLLIKGSMHTAGNRFGAQGVLIEVTPSKRKPVRFLIGEEYRLFRWLGVHAAVGSNPVLISLGVVAEWKMAGAVLSFVNHPELGWSKGFYTEYVAGRFNEMRKK